ncbi:uncharacterized protein [Pseudochaenichthys georgianus]|uniref:uncharacterized protein isoform X1 n=2 Tax=Pseudochaenichthys georgianus TaxID=52239 RepID=UPI00146A1B8C|nr:uncharacterized protein LOC117445074 [Pseudochaenichthys georgianus]
MSAVVKTLIQGRPVGKDFFLSSNIPFLDRDRPDAFSTRFQEEYRPFTSKKAEPFSPPTAAQVDHKDLRHIKEYRTDAKESYHAHKMPQITRIPAWTMLQTNFKMQTDPGEEAFLTTQSQQFCHQPFQPPPSPIRQIETPKAIQHAEKLPESTNQASYTPHNCCPVLKASAKHLAVFPTIKGDRRHQSLLSHYNNSFLGAWSRAAVPVEKHSGVAMGDPVNIVERETTHAVSFSRPTGCSPPVLTTERLKLSLGSLSPIWSSTTREAFPHYKIEDPVVVTKRNDNYSSLPKGDTDTRHDKERMSVTTNRTSFYDLSLTALPVHVPGTDLMTKSHVQFGPSRLSSMCYSTTAKENFSKQDGERARPAIPLPSNILSGAERDLNPSTTKCDYLPVKASRRTPFPSQQMSHLRFPLAHQYFRTIHSEEYTAKPLIFQRPGLSQLTTNFVIQ